MLTAQTPWEEAQQELVALPAEHQSDYGDDNFLRAGRFRRNGKALWEHVRSSLMAPGENYEVVLGFVDASVANASELGKHEFFVPAMTQFLAVHLRCSATGAELAAELQTA